MKIIDLLNIWVEDRNKLPEKIKIEDKIFEFDKGCNLYKAPDEDCFLIQNYLTCAERLYAKVEVIEENKEIKELYEHKTINYTQTDIRANREKINELARAVNKINKQLEEQETEDIDTVERELNKMFKEREAN